MFASLRNADPHLRQRHFNLWITVIVAAFSHFWVAWALLAPFPKGDLILNSYLFEVVPPLVWAAFAVTTGLGMLYGVYIGPFVVQQVSAAWGVLMASALVLNGLAEIVRLYLDGMSPPLAVRLLPALGAVYVIGHFAFATEPPENPATRK